MKLQTAVFALMGMIFLFTAKSSAQQVSTDYQSGANFEHYKTYSWGQVKADNPQDIDRIKNAVDGALTAKGWTQLDSGADVSITATAGEKTRIQPMHVSYEGITGGSGWVPGPGAVEDIQTSEVGTLVVVLFDAETKQPLWRGSSTETLSNNSDKNTKNLDKGLEKMFQSFPPDSSNERRARRSGVQAMTADEPDSAACPGIASSSGCAPADSSAK